MLVEIIINGKVFKSEGESLEKAFDNLKLDWFDVKNKGVIKIKDGNKEKELVFLRNKLKKVFVNKLNKLIFAKQLSKYVNF